MSLNTTNLIVIRQVLNTESGSKTFKCDDWLLKLKYKSNYQFSKLCCELLILFESVYSIGKYFRGSNVIHASTQEYNIKPKTI